MDVWLAALLYLVVSFDGTPATCLMDTGANANWISQSLADRIGTIGEARERGAVNVDSFTGANATTYAKHIVPNVGTARVSAGNLPVLVAPDSYMTAMGSECVLGVPFLRASGGVLLHDGLYHRSIILHAPIPQS